jgi:adenylosuccinate lyase
MTTEASVIKSLLEGYDIPCHYSSVLPHQVNPLSLGRLTEIQIYVPAALATVARRLLEEHRRTGHLHLVEN